MTDKSKALFELFQSEKKHEERTKAMLDDLERNSAAMQRAKVQLVEKLLDIAVKDELSQLTMAEDAQTLRYFAEAGATVAQHHSSRRYMDDVIKTNLTTSRNEYPDGFISKLDQMLQLSDAEARTDVSNMVSKYLDPHMAAYRLRKQGRAQEETLASIAIAAEQVREERLKEVLEERTVRVRRETLDRTSRVEAASKQFKKHIGDIGALLFVQPVEYKTDIGKREAEINDLRCTIMSQRAEEERLVQERSIQLSLIDANLAKITAEAEQLQQKLALLRREQETKLLELKEMQEASRSGGSGAWASNTIQLEKELSLATEQEFKLKQELDGLKRTGEVIIREKESLDDELAAALDELKTAQQEHHSVLERLEQRLTAARQTMLGYRSEEQRLTREINELRHRMVHRREDVRRQKRAFRETLNTIMGQLSIEDHCQSLLMARSLELQKQIEKISTQADHHIASLQGQMTKVNADLNAKGEQIRNYAVELTNYYTGSLFVKEIKLTPVQLQTQIDAVQKEAERLEKEAADQIASVASRIDNNLRENELTLKQMGWYAMLQEDVGAEGVDVAETSVEELKKLREHLYSELTQRSYREGKYTQCIRMLRDRLARRQRGESIQPLTLNRRTPLTDRRARADVFDKSRQAKDHAQEHLRRHQIQSHATASRAIAMQDPSTADGRMANASAMSNFRSLVIGYIKKELQPLYDNNQISKARFVDCVHRVSSWYLEHHQPTAELSQHHMTLVNRKIQEVLTWQDEQRLSMRVGGVGGLQT